jgi:hypothetical protein
MFGKIFSSSEEKNMYNLRKTKKSSNPAIAFFQEPAKEQKKAWKRIILNSNYMQREIMEN